MGLIPTSKDDFREEILFSAGSASHLLLVTFSRRLLPVKTASSCCINFVLWQKIEKDSRFWNIMHRCTLDLKKSIIVLSEKNKTEPDQTSKLLAKNDKVQYWWVPSTAFINAQSLPLFHPQLIFEIVSQYILTDTQINRNIITCILQIWNTF